MAESANLLERELEKARAHVARLERVAEARKVITELVADDPGLIPLLLDGLPQQPRPADGRRAR